LVADKQSAASDSGRRAILAGTIAAVAAVGQLVMGKAVRDGFFLVNFEAQELPRMMMVAAVASFASVLVVSRAMSRFSPFRVMPVLFGTAALLLVGHALLSQVAPGVAAVALYLHMAVFGSTAVSGFWSLVNERYDPHTAKRVVSRLAGGATIGGILGGLLAWQAAARMPVSVLMYVMGGLNLVCLLGVLGIGDPDRSMDARSPTRAPLLPGLETLRQAPYLRKLASLVVLTSVASALLDYLLGVFAKATYDNSAELVSFYALYQLGIGLLSFVVLSAAGRPSLKLLGLAGTVALLPGAVVVGSILALALPSLWSALAVRGTDAIMRNSLYRSGYELLFTPIAAERKRATKLIIDVAFDRVGTAVGSALALAVVFLAGLQTERVILILIVLFSMAALWVAMRLHEGYVNALEESLRAGSVKLDANEVMDVTTWRTLTQTNLELDRGRILEEIERLRQAEAQKVEGPDAAPASDVVVQAICTLRSGDPDRIRRVLAGTAAVDALLVAHIIPLLTAEALREDAVHALRKVSHQANGQLVDALLDPEKPVLLRRRMARVLRTCFTQRAVDGLLAGLSDKRFEVRYQCGVSLWSMAEEAPQLVMPREMVLDAVRREVEVERDVWEARACAEVADNGEESVCDDLIEVRKSRSLEHVFRLLSLTLDREPVMLAMRALGGGDSRLRGTSLEYLENVLPSDIRDRLWPFLDAGRPTDRTPRPRKDVLEELLASGTEVSLERVRRSLEE
jgi:hypothetical protein